MGKLLRLSFVFICMININTSMSQPTWSSGDAINYNSLTFQFKPVRDNTIYGQYYGIGNTFIDAGNNISINTSTGSGLIDQGNGNLGSAGLEYDMWLNGDVDDLCIYGLYDQNTITGHIYPYVSIQYLGNFDIIPPATANYISGSVHTYAFGNNHNYQYFPYFPLSLYNSGDGKGAAVYSYLKNPSGVKKFRLKGYRTNDFVYVPYPWELYDVPLSLPATAQVLDVVGADGYIYILYSVNTSALKVLVYDYDGNQINTTAYTHSLGTANTFNMSSIQFYIDGSTLNIIGDCFKSGKHRIFADKLTSSGFTYQTILPLTGNSQGSNV